MPGKEKGARDPSQPLSKGMAQQPAQPSLAAESHGRRREPQVKSIRARAKQLACLDGLREQKKDFFFHSLVNSTLMYVLREAQAQSQERRKKQKDGKGKKMTLSQRLRDKKEEKKKREMEKGGSKNKTCSTVPSNPLPDDSTTTARPSLTALFEWEAVTLGDVAAYAHLATTTNIMRLHC